MHRTFVGEVASVAVVAYTALAVVGGGPWLLPALLAIAVMVVAVVEVMTAHRAARTALVALTVGAALVAVLGRPEFLAPAVTGAAMLATLPRPSRSRATDRDPARIRLTTEHVFATVGSAARTDGSHVEGGSRDDESVLPTRRDGLLPPSLEPRV